MIGMSLPPTKPMVPVLVTLAAMTPTRNDPSQSFVTVEMTFGAIGSGPTSTRPNFWLGKAAAAACIGLIMSKDEPMMMSKPWPAARASVDWNSEMLRGWMVTYSASSSFTARFMPSFIMSLNERSPSPDSEVTNATLILASAAEPKPIAARARNAPVFTTDLGTCVLPLFFGAAAFFDPQLEGGGLLP